MTTPGPSSGIGVGVYRGSSVDISAIQAYEEFLGMPSGTTVDYVLAYMADNPSWPQFEAGILAATTGGAPGVMKATDWVPALGGTRKLTLSIPACCGGTTWADELSGKNDAHWIALTKTLVSGGLGMCHVRIAREFNNTAYAWHASPANAAQYTAGYARICKLMRDNGFNGQFIWNAALGLGTMPTLASLLALYPSWGNGNFGLDFSDTSASYPPGETIRTQAQQQATWNQLLTQPGGLNDWQAFALLKKTGLCYPEWGLRLQADAGVYRGGGDNSLLIREMSGWLKSTGPFMHAFWEDTDRGVMDPDWDLRRIIAVPASRAEFLYQFGWTQP